MPKQPSTKVLKTCRIEKHYIEYCTMQGINFNGIVNELLRAFVVKHERNSVFRSEQAKREIEVILKPIKEP